MNTPHCWALTTGEAGMISQALGLAEVVGIPFEHKTVDLRIPWRWLPGHLCPNVWRGLTVDSDSLTPPWPDLLIACGRRSVAVSLAIRRAASGRTFTVYIQDPRIPSYYFDLVVPPQHDGLHGVNVISTRGALHRVTPARLTEHAARFAPQVESLPQPLVVVLIGGSSRNCRLTPAFSADIGRQLLAMVRVTGAGLALTTSRRTGAENEAALRKVLQAVPHYFWDGHGDNPYFGLLGLADHIVVTGDSVSMVSEACATGKPVHIIDLPGCGRRLQTFHDQLRHEGVTRPFKGDLDHWTYEPVNDAPHVAAQIRKHLKLADG